MGNGQKCLSSSLTEGEEKIRFPIGRPAFKTFFRGFLKLWKINEFGKILVVEDRLFCPILLGGSFYLIGSEISRQLQGYHFTDFDGWFAKIILQYPRHPPVSDRGKK